MIFAKTHHLVSSGLKTQTRRLWKAGYELDSSSKPTTLYHNGRVQYQVGRDYAVQPGRGREGIGRVHITRLWKQRLSKIRPQEAAAEGIWSEFVIDPVAAYLKLWAGIHDKPGTRVEDDPYTLAIEFIWLETHRSRANGKEIG